ncbi:MAG: SusC/RagA family TonB-linked outer membrane protein [Flavobacteriia bacterium]|nr:MAG: SusC/RagA family TonB-linked outer membrane protein [Flavobacteriia bacterium]
MKTKFNGILTLLLALSVQFVFAQKTVSGTVTDESGPLPGVNIIIKGTTSGTDTDFDGNYSIDVKQGDVLVFSYVGMVTVEKTVGAENRIDVTMKAENVLDEVVIVGYGTATKKSFTGSVKTVDSKKIESKSVSNVASALVGEAAGVTVINTSGQPGTVPTIRIRGFGSVNGNRDPLYVVDGVPFSGNLNTINPADIESTNILKDATATAIYGSRGANGVVLINTKRGSSNTSRITVEMKAGLNTAILPRHSRITSPEEYIEISWNALYNKGVLTGQSDPAAYASQNLYGDQGIDPKYNVWAVDGADLIDPTTGKIYPGIERRYNPENWEDYGFQDAFRNETNISLSGGQKNTKYFTSFGYISDQGNIINSDFNRISARVNVNHKIKPWLSGVFNLGYANTTTNNNGQSNDSGSIFWFSDNIPSIYPLFLRDENGNLIDDHIYGGYVYDYGIGRGFGALTNSIADATYNRRRGKRNALDGKIALNLTILEGLTFENSFGGQFSNYLYNNLNNPYYGSAAEQGGSIFKYNSEFKTYTLLNLLRYKTSWGDHNFEALAAHEATNWLDIINTASKEKMVHPDLDDLNNFVIVSSPPTSYTKEWRIESYFGKVDYNFMNKYFLTGSLRRDGSSRFVENKWGTFGSLGASWVISAEDFFSGVEKSINYMKLKASYGTVGEQAGVGLYPGYTLFEVGNLNDEISLSEDFVGNKDLTWETSKMLQFGLESRFFDRIDFDIDYFIKDTENLLFDRRVGPSVGYALITVNDGELRNSALEFDLSSDIFNGENFKLNFLINGAFLRNELTKMPIDPATGKEKILDIAGVYGRSKGHSLYDFYMREWAGVDSSDGSAMWNVYYYDENNNGEMDGGEKIRSLYEYQVENPNHEISQTTTKNYTDATELYVDKSAIPLVSGGLRIGGSYKKFDFGAQFLYSLGGYAMDYKYRGLMSNNKIGGNNWSTDIRDRWQQEGDVTDVPRLSSGEDTNYNSTSTRFLTKSDYLSFNNFRIGYTLDKEVEKTGLSSVNIWLSGDNLYLLSARKGFNPTQSETGSSSTYTYSPLTNFSLGVRVNF